MARYDRSYDYGLRGYDEGTAARRNRSGRPIRYDYDFGFRGYPGEFVPNRVTARYNMDYVMDDQDPRYERDRYPINDGFDERIVGAGEYARPYYTIGGTHTGRGRTPSVAPSYDRDFRYGGRPNNRYDRGFRRR